MSDRSKKRYAKKMLSKVQTKEASEEVKETYIIDANKLTDINSIQKAFELLKIRFIPPNEEAYKEYKSILSKEEEVLK